MSIEGQPGLRPKGVDPVQAPGTPQGVGQPRPEQAVEFRRLLEQLAGLKRKPTGEGGDGGDGDPALDGARQLREALHRADQDYATAMDLRRQLEDAFRRYQP